MDELKRLIDSGEFHHATYRCQGSLWEGLWIYRKSATGFRGYEPATCVYKNDPALDEAYRIINRAGHGTHLGSYGNG